MTAEAEFIIELWESLRDCVPNSKREEIANVLLTSCINYGFSYADICSIEDEDELLGNVLKNLVDFDEEEPEEDEY
jgi:hypothetical protein